MAWKQITAPHFVACVAVTSDVVTEAAPILRYMVGWTLLQVQRYCTKRGWQLES